MLIPWLQTCAQHAQSMHLGFSPEGVACWVWRPMEEWKVSREPHSLCGAGRLRQQFLKAHVLRRINDLQL
eukprot:365570-Chlamydomonas_euryale.AAC.3